MLNALLLLFLHGLAWFCFGAFCAMIRGYGTMKMLSALSLGIISGSAHLLAQHLGYLP